MGIYFPALDHPPGDFPVSAGNPPGGMVYHLIFHEERTEGVEQGPDVYPFQCFAALPLLPFRHLKTRIPHLLPMFPLAMWYSFYCYGILFRYRIRWVVAVILAAGIAFQASFFFERYHTRSIFPAGKDWSRAINEMDYTIAGLRRESKVVQMNREELWTKYAVNGRQFIQPGFEVDDSLFPATGYCKLHQL